MVDIDDARFEFAELGALGEHDTFYDKFGKYLSPLKKLMAV